MPMKLVTTIAATVVANIASEMAGLFSRKIRTDEDASVLRFLRFFRKNRFRSALNCSEKGIRVRRAKDQKIQNGLETQPLVRDDPRDTIDISIAIVSFDDLLNEVMTDNILSLECVKVNTVQ
jgi:hypothetical protein